MKDINVSQLNNNTKDKKGNVKMAIKYVVIPEKKTVKAILENTEYDAYNKINKMMRNTGFCVCSDKYRMPNRFVAVVVCDARDEFDVDFGKGRARKIVLDNYYKSLDKKIGYFREDVLTLNGRVFENPVWFEETPLTN